MKPWNKGLKKGNNISCQTCGTNFYLSQKGSKKFCSQQCYFLRNGNKTKKNCVVCDKEFFANPSRKNQIFCSNHCRFVFMKGKMPKNINQIKGWHKGRDSRIEKKCGYCGKLIKIKPSKVMKNNFCSIECFSKYNSGKNHFNYGKKISEELFIKLKEANEKKLKNKYEKMWIDALDGKIVVKYNHPIKRINQRRALSELRKKDWQNLEYRNLMMERLKKRYEYMRQRTPEEHPMWAGGKSFEPYSKEFNEKFKIIIRQRDNICMKCGRTNEQDLQEFGRQLHVHHINYDKKLTIPENCCALCNRCNLEVNLNREKWTQFFQILLSEKYGYEYPIKFEIINEEVK